MKSFFRFWGSVFIGAYVLAPALVLAAGPAPTCFMSTNPSSIPVGGSVTLTWGSVNATGAAITNVGNVEPNGQRNLLPSSALTTTYVGSFTGPGGTANCSASVTVFSNSGPPSSDLDPTGGVQSGGGTITNTGTGQFATNPTTGSSLSSNTGGEDNGGLVSCGTGAGYIGATSCQACNLAQLVQRIINFLIGVSIPVAAALFAWAGILYFSSGARPSNIEDAKKIFASAFIGFLIVLASWLAINTILHTLLDQREFPNGSWFSIQCTGGRQVSGEVEDIFKRLPGVNIAPISSGNISVACNYGEVWQNGQCFNPLTSATRSPTAVVCQEGSTYNAGAFSCVNGEGEITAPANNVNLTISGAIGTAGATAGDLVLRQQLADAGVNVISTGNCADRTSSTCTSLDGVNPTLINNLVQMKNDGLSFAVSGGTEPGHQASAQQNGNSVDLSACNSSAGFNDASAVASCIQNFSTSAAKVGRRLDYECQTDAQVNAVKSALGNDGITKVIKVGYATGSGNFPCHFSVY